MLLPVVSRLAVRCLEFGGVMFADNKALDRAVDGDVVAGDGDEVREGTRMPAAAARVGEDDDVEPPLHDSTRGSKSRVTG